jgi:3-hydroxyacyl-CoA dehydrogenase
MMPVEFDVTGKVVFITGAGRGIGKGIAQVVAEAGADVALNAIARGIFPDVGTFGEEGMQQTMQRAQEAAGSRLPGALPAAAVSDWMTGQTILLDGGLSL